MALKITGADCLIGTTLGSPSSATVGFWFRRSSQDPAGGPTLFVFGSSTGRVLEYNDVPRIQLASITPTNDFSVAVGDWFYVAFVKNGGNLALHAYADVSSETRTAVNAEDYLPTTLDVVKFGDVSAIYNVAYLNGESLHLRAWNSMLTTAQINTEKNSATPVITSGLILDVPMSSSLTANTGTSLSLEAGSGYEFTANVPSVLAGGASIVPHAMAGYRMRTA